MQLNSKMDPLLELDQKIERLKKPPLERDFVHFMRVGLNGIGINPHKLKAGRNTTQEKFVEVFGKGTPRSGF